MPQFIIEDDYQITCPGCGGVQYQDISKSLYCIHCGDDLDSKDLKPVKTPIIVLVNPLTNEATIKPPEPPERERSPLFEFAVDLTRTFGQLYKETGR